MKKLSDFLGFSLPPVSGLQEFLLSNLLLYSFSMSSMIFCWKSMAACSKGLVLGNNETYFRFLGKNLIYLYFCSHSRIYCLTDSSLSAALRVCSFFCIFLISISMICLYLFFRKNSFLIFFSYPFLFPSSLPLRVSNCSTFSGLISSFFCSLCLMALSRSLFFLCRSLDSLLCALAPI